LTTVSCVLDAPESVYAAVPIPCGGNVNDHGERSEKYERKLTLDAETSDNAALRMGGKDVNCVASFVETQLRTKEAVVLPYAAIHKSVLGKKSVEVLDKDAGDGCCFEDNGEDVTTVGVNKEEERLACERVPRRTAMAKTNTPAPVVDKDYFNWKYKQTVLGYWTAPYDKQVVLKYLSIHNARPKRGCSYQKFAETLYALGNEYLSPEEFVKSDGKLYKWESNFPMRPSNYGGMGEFVLRLGRMKDRKDDDWCLAAGASFTMYLWDSPVYKKKESWNAWVSVRKSTIDNAGNGLFAAKEFQKGETVGFYVGNVVYKYGKKWTTKASEEFLQEELGFLEADGRTMTLVDKEGFRVVVNPCYGRKREKIADPPLLMGMHFLNDFTQIYDEQTGGGLKEKMMRHNNVWMDDRGGIKATKRVLVGEELFLSGEGKRPPYVDKNLTATAKRKVTGTNTIAEIIGVASVGKRRGTVDSRGKEKLEEGPRKKKKK
jgi:hypothetical protein